MNYNILVVDDEKELADVIELYLTGNGCTVYKCCTGAEALDCIAHTDLDLAILDVMLPDADGFQICRKIREKSYFPIIMLTAKTADVDKITGLSIGADDYITAPGALGTWLCSILPAGGTSIQASVLYAITDFQFLNLAGLSVWTPYAMIGACVIEIPLFAFLAVRSYCRHALN